MLPVLPLHRLRQRPTVRATLADITCDSDGHLTRFVLAEEEAVSGGDGSGLASLSSLAEPPSPALLLHPLESRGEGTHAPYVLGMFLGGVYQETMGSAHNLFGAPTVVHVIARDGDGGELAASGGALA